MSSCCRHPRASPFSRPRSLPAPRPWLRRGRGEAEHTLASPHRPQKEGGGVNTLASSLQADLGTLNIENVHISKRMTLEISVPLSRSTYFPHFSSPWLFRAAPQGAGAAGVAPAHFASAAL